jgi:hypothetical protein
MTLEMGTRGVFDSFGFAPTTRVAPGAGEIEVRVHATGLKHPGTAGSGTDVRRGKSVGRRS